MAGSQLVVVNYLFGLIFLPLLDWKLLRNRNSLNTFQGLSQATVLTLGTLRKYLQQQCWGPDLTPLPATYLLSFTRSKASARRQSWHADK